MNKGMRIGDEMGSLDNYKEEKSTAQIIDFDPTLIKVEATKYRGTIHQRKKYIVVETNNDFFMNVGDVYYQISAGDYILEDVKTGERFVVTKEKKKTLENFSEIDPFLIRKSML